MENRFNNFNKDELDIVYNALKRFRYDFVRAYKKAGPPLNEDDLQKAKETIEQIALMDSLIQECENVEQTE